MRFILSFQTNNKTYFFEHGKKEHYNFIAMISAIMFKMMQLGISKEDLETCINLAEKYNKDMEENHNGFSKNFRMQFKGR